MTETLRLIADNIEIHAGELRLVSGISFELHSGRALILRGSNGIGKTSLLSVLAGLTRPALGNVRLVGGKQSQEYGVAENCHFLGHKLGLKLHQTVDQNLTFFSKFYGEDRAKLLQTASTLSLSRLIDLPVRLLSAGQKQRTAFARLMLTERPVWLLDEPTASLDTQTSRLIEKICEAHLETDGIIIAATHLPFLESAGITHSIDLEDFVPNQRWVEQV